MVVWLNNSNKINTYPDNQISNSNANGQHGASGNNWIHYSPSNASSIDNAFNLTTTTTSGPSQTPPSSSSSSSNLRSPSRSPTKSGSSVSWMSALEQLLIQNSPSGGTEFNNPHSYQSKALQWMLSHPPPSQVLSPTSLETQPSQQSEKSQNSTIGPVSWNKNVIGIGKANVSNHSGSNGSSHSTSDAIMESSILTTLTATAPTEYPTISPSISTLSPTLRVPVVATTGSRNSRIGGGTNLPTMASTKSFPSPSSESAGLEGLVNQTKFNQTTTGSTSTTNAIGYTNNVSSIITTTQRLLQRYALACVYYATNNVTNNYMKERNMEAEPWTNATGWLVNDQECTWRGVTCDPTSGAVTAINLSNNRLSGAMPIELIYLQQQLKSLDASKNSIDNSGGVGNQAFGQLTNLQQLYLGDTFVQYFGIPYAFQFLTNLVELDVSYTQFIGPLDGSLFASMSNLEYLVLSGNSYGSGLPMEIASLPSLRYLSIADADLTGSLYPTFGSFGSNSMAWESLKGLWLDHNPQLKGTIPSGMGSMTALTSLSLSSCGLDGSLPSELGNLKQLQVLSLWNNSLTGTIPSQLSQLNQLQTLALEENDLTGSVPSSVCSLKKGALQSFQVDCPIKIDCSGMAGCCTCCGSGNTSQCSSISIALTQIATKSAGGSRS